MQQDTVRLGQGQGGQTEHNDSDAARTVSAHSQSETNLKATVRSEVSTYVHLDGGGSLAVLGGNSGGLNDLDGLVTGSVATGHVVICASTQ
jgi:hypothetical protein